MKNNQHHQNMAAASLKMVGRRKSRDCYSSVSLIVTCYTVEEAMGGATPVLVDACSASTFCHCLPAVGACPRPSSSLLPWEVGCPAWMLVFLLHYKLRTYGAIITTFTRTICYLLHWWAGGGTADYTLHLAFGGNIPIELFLGIWYRETT